MTISTQNFRPDISSRVSYAFLTTNGKLGVGSGASDQATAKDLCGSCPYEQTPRIHIPPTAASLRRGIENWKSKSPHLPAVVGGALPSEAPKPRRYWIAISAAPISEFEESGRGVISNAAHSRGVEYNNSGRLESLTP